MQRLWDFDHYAPPIKERLATPGLRPAPEPFEPPEVAKLVDKAGGRALPIPIRPAKRTFRLAAVGVDGGSGTEEDEPPEFLSPNI